MAETSTAVDELPDRVKIYVMKDNSNFEMWIKEMLEMKVTIMIKSFSLTMGVLYWKLTILRAVFPESSQQLFKLPPSTNNEMAFQIFSVMLIHWLFETNSLFLKTKTIEFSFLLICYYFILF